MKIAKTCEKLGAGGMLNYINKDWAKSDCDIEVFKHISNNASTPVIASSRAGKVDHFT